jgi:hypothetical protein
MTIHPKIELLAKYETLEQCILSGQVPEPDIIGRMRGDPQFARWLSERASARQSQKRQEL